MKHVRMSRGGGENHQINLPVGYKGTTPMYSIRTIGNHRIVSPARFNSRGEPSIFSLNLETGQFFQNSNERQWDHLPEEIKRAFSEENLAPETKRRVPSCSYVAAHRTEKKKKKGKSDIQNLVKIRELADPQGSH